MNITALLQGSPSDSSNRRRVQSNDDRDHWYPNHYPPHPLSASPSALPSPAPSWGSPHSTSFDLRRKQQNLAGPGTGAPISDEQHRSSHIPNRLLTKKSPEEHDDMDLMHHPRQQQHRQPGRSNTPTTEFYRDRHHFVDRDRDLREREQRPIADRDRNVMPPLSRHSYLSAPPPPPPPPPPPQPQSTHLHTPPGPTASSGMHPPSGPGMPGPPSSASPHMQTSPGVRPHHRNISGNVLPHPRDRDRERPSEMSSQRDREREMLARERERDIHMQREREQRERDRIVHREREREAHSRERDREREMHGPPRDREMLGPLPPPPERGPEPQHLNIHPRGVHPHPHSHSQRDAREREVHLQQPQPQPPHREVLPPYAQNVPSRELHPHHPNQPSHVPHPQHQPPPHQPQPQPQQIPPPQKDYQTKFQTSFRPGLITQPNSRIASPMAVPPPDAKAARAERDREREREREVAREREREAGKRIRKESHRDREGEAHVPGVATPVRVEDTPMPMPMDVNMMNNPPTETVTEPPVEVGFPDLDDRHHHRHHHHPVPVTNDLPVVVEQELEEPGSWDVRAKTIVRLGTYIYPNLPFPYFFDLGAGLGRNQEEGRKDEQGMEHTTKEQETSKDSKPGDDKDTAKEKEDKVNVEKEGPEPQKVDNSSNDTLLDIETRATIIIPNGYIPHSKPSKPRIWGGGSTSVNLPKRKNASGSRANLTGKSSMRPRSRRIYTDDSELFLCTVHAGWVTWSGAAKAKARGCDMRVEVRVIRCSGSSPDNVVVADGSVSSSDNEGVRKRKEEVVGRFVGGWGEKCWNTFGRKGLAQGEKVEGAIVEEDEEDEEEEDGNFDDDGRGLVSAGWGSGHDGSAIEVVGVEFVQKGTARSSPNLGRRNRSQRLLEYNERRATLFDLSHPNYTIPRIPTIRLAGRKRRRRDCEWPTSASVASMRRLPNASVLDVIPEEDEYALIGDAEEKEKERVEMDVRTVMFASLHGADVTQGFKHDPEVLKRILFHSPVAVSTVSSSKEYQPPPRKKRRTTIVARVPEDVPTVMDVDTNRGKAKDQDSGTGVRAVILETTKESYLLSPSVSEGTEGGRKYDIALIFDVEDIEVEYVAPAGETKVEQPPVSSSTVSAVTGEAEIRPEEPPPTAPKEMTLKEGEEESHTNKLTIYPPVNEDNDKDKETEKTVIRIGSPLESGEVTPTEPIFGRKAEVIVGVKEIEGGKSNVDELEQKNSSFVLESPVRKDRTLPSADSTPKRKTQQKSQAQEDVEMKASSEPQSGATTSAVDVPPSDPKSTVVPTTIDTTTAATTAIGNTVPQSQPKHHHNHHPLVQVLQRNLGEEMFRFTKDGVCIVDGVSSAGEMETEWSVIVKCWKWAPNMNMKK